MSKKAKPFSNAGSLRAMACKASLKGRQPFQKKQTAVRVLHETAVVFLKRRRRDLKHINCFEPPTNKGSLASSIAKCLQMSSNNVELIKNTIAINTTMICFNRIFKKEDIDKPEFTHLPVIYTSRRRNVLVEIFRKELFH